MPKQLIINSANFNINNNKFVYKFPVRQRFKKGDKVGLSSISIYNSFFNISSVYNNNYYTFTFPSATPIDITFTIPNGYYSISDLNYYFQQQCILNGLYCTSSSNSSSNIYFMEFTTNAVRYAGQINLYALPTASQATTMGYAIPSNASWSFPSIANTPSININIDFGLLLGFSNGIYPLIPSSTNIQFVSNICPNLSVVNSLIMTCNLIDNSGISIPSTIFDSIPLTVGFGSLINSNSSQIIYSDIASNDYDNIEIQFYDQNLNLLTILDSDVLITLSLEIN
jgi:hypothetical protein